MIPIRVLTQSNSTDLDNQLAGLLQRAAETRKESGCLEAEYFRGIEFPENLAYIELWESQAAYDAHWARQLGNGMSREELRLLAAPLHYGTTAAPRRHGHNGMEFYPYTPFERVDNAWLPKNTELRSSAIRWPSRSGVRIISQGNAADDDYLTQTAIETRTEPGCAHFEHLRSVEFAENSLLLELWDSAAIYDVHWLHRVLQRMWGWGVAGGSQPNRPPFERRVGQAGIEFYQHSYYTLVGDVWEPERPEERMTTVRWP